MMTRGKARASTELKEFKILEFKATKIRREFAYL